jgi:hypothetical protein
MILQEDIVRLLDTHEFKPFRVHVTDGVSYDVRKRWQVLPLARSVIIGFPGPALPPHVAGDSVNVALIHITRLEPLNLPDGGNGQIGN